MRLPVVDNDLPGVVDAMVPGDANDKVGFYLAGAAYHAVKLAATREEFLRVCALAFERAGGEG